MPNVLLLATAWGPKHGGINAFNMDFATALAAHLKANGRVFCAVLEASSGDSERAKAAGVTLVALEKGHQRSEYDEHWAHAVQEMLPAETPIDWWVGHDVISVEAAVKGAQEFRGRSAVIMHMNYADYASYKYGSGSEAVKKEARQRKLFQRADKHFAVGPVLRDAMRDLVEPPVTMLVPGFADMPIRPAEHRLTLITFGRMDRESDRIKQGALAVAGFATACRRAKEIIGLPEVLGDNPRMRVIGIREEMGEEEDALRKLAFEKAGREINLVAQPFDEDRPALFDLLGRANIAMMLSWHEGFGLTGWEAVAAEVPLIVTKQSGLYSLVEEALEEPGTACLHPIDVQGREGGDDAANFTESDEIHVCDSIVKIARDVPRARRNAQRLKQLLQQQLTCTWQHTARQFCVGLGSELNSVSPFVPGTAPADEETAASTSIEGVSEASEKAEEGPPPLIGLPERPWPASLAIEMPDSIMLLPQSEVVPFHSYRRDLLDEVLRWALDEDQPITLRLQAGEGGTGKTRLAIAACHELEDHYGWRVGFLRTPDLIESEFPKLLRENRDCLVVVDYAETRTGDVIALAEKALKASRTCKVRLLLLARDGGDWWDSLAKDVKDPVVAAILRRLSTKTGPFRMSEEPIEPEARSAVFEEALAAFAKEKELPVDGVATPDLSADHFGQMLFIHLAALAKLRGFTATGDRELLDMALGHERAYWRHLLEGAGPGEAWLDGLEQSIALLTLVGGVNSAREAKALIGRTPRLRGQPLDIKTQLFDLLRRLYRRSGGLAGLQPDVLGERLVAEALARDDELIDILLETQNTPDQARHALTVLTRLAKRDPAERRWLARALERHIAGRVQEAFEVAFETGSPMPEAIVAALRAAERGTQRRVVRALRLRLPDETVNLQGLATDIADRHVEFVRSERRNRAGWKTATQLREAYEALAERHVGKGDYKEAAEARERVVESAKLTVRSGKSAGLVSLAAAQVKLGAALSRIGSFEAALEHTAEGEVTLREAALRKPGQYRNNWANSLSSLSRCLDNLGHYEEALAKAEQAEAIHRELAVQQREAYRNNWANSLGSLANRLGTLGRYEEALAKAKQAETVHRELAVQQPESYRGNWAASLGNLASRLAVLGRYEEALAKAEQAEAIQRELATRQPDTYRDGWATSLGRLASCLGTVGRYKEALAKAEQAETIRRELAARQPDAYRAEWATSLHNLASCLGTVGRYEEALAKAEQAETIRRELAARQPDTYRREWVTSLHNLASCLGTVGRYEEALTKAEQAEAIHRDLAARQPETYRAGWASGLGNLASRLAALGRYEEALAKAEQAEAIQRELATRQPDAHQSDWTSTLANLANHLRDLERYEEALAKAEQAETIQRELASRHPDAHRPTWALSLGNLAEITILCGRASDAISVAGEAVAVLGELAIYPNVDRDWLGWCKRVLAEALLKVGDAKLALERAREADRIWAIIFAERPAYACEQYAKMLPVLARAERAAEGPAPAIRTLEQGIRRIEPYFEQRPAALQKVMQELIDTFQEIDAAAAQELVPASVIETLSQLPRRA